MRTPNKLCSTTRFSYTERNLKNMLLPKETYIKSEFSADFKYVNRIILKIVLFLL